MVFMLYNRVRMIKIRTVPDEACCVDALFVRDLSEAVARHHLPHSSVPIRVPRLRRSCAAQTLSRLDARAYWLPVLRARAAFLCNPIMFLLRKVRKRPGAAAIHWNHRPKPGKSSLNSGSSPI